MTDTIVIKGLDQLTKKIKNIEGLKPVIAALRAGALHVKGKIAPYPPPSIANSPSQKRWYERGYGPRWHRVDGSLGGRKTSETLRKKWAIGERDGGLTQIVGNNVSYGPFVQGDRQAAFHRERGWKTTDQVAEEEAETVNKFVQEHIEKALSD